MLGCWADMVVLKKDRTATAAGLGQIRGMASCWYSREALNGVLAAARSKSEGKVAVAARGA